MVVRHRQPHQMAFRLPQGLDLLPGEIIVDSFASGGGASLGIEAATGRSPDIAINHDQEAIRMHMENHPNTRHYCEDVWLVNPRKVCEGRPVGIMWASPDCRHFSRAKGGAPVSKRVRGLAWVVVSWARQVKPRIICLENVPEFTTWGPVGKDDQPIKAKSGETFERWVGQLRRIGYDVQWTILNAADYGAPTARRRIFLVARRDGKPIRFPVPTHGPKRPLPWRTAAECIDFTRACPSIFPGHGRKRRLARATEARIARGLDKFLFRHPDPFVVEVNHGRDHFRGQATDKPLHTITGRHGFGLASPHLTHYYGQKGKDTRAAEVTDPLSTITGGGGGAGGKFGLVAPSLVGIDHRGSGAGAAWPVQAPLGTITRENHYGGVVGQHPKKPLGTITSKDHHSLASGHMTKLYGTATGADLRQPTPTQTSGGGHLAPVFAYITKYYGTARTGQKIDAPLDTITAKDRMALVKAGFGDDLSGAIRCARFLMQYLPNAPVTWVEIKGKARPVVFVAIKGDMYLLTDIGLRMLQPDELAKAQGFPDNYALTGTKSEQVAKIGNSVPPPVAEALVRANLMEEPALLMEDAA